MNSTETISPKSYWFVGVSYGKGSEDQTRRFLKEGIWQNGYKDKYLDLVRSMPPGDRIAIKSSYTRKRNISETPLPNNRNNHIINNEIVLFVYCWLFVSSLGVRLIFMKRIVKLDRVR